MDKSSDEGCVDGKTRERMEIQFELLRGHSPFKMLKNVKNMFSQIFA